MLASFIQVHLYTQHRYGHYKRNVKTNYKYKWITNWIRPVFSSLIYIEQQLKIFYVNR